MTVHRFLPRTLEEDLQKQQLSFLLGVVLTPEHSPARADLLNHILMQRTWRRLGVPGRSWWIPLLQITLGGPGMLGGIPSL